MPGEVEGTPGFRPEGTAWGRVVGGTLGCPPMLGVSHAELFTQALPPQRVPLLLQLLWQDLQDLPGVIEVLRNLWGCVAQHGLVPLSPHQGPCKHPGQL